MSHWKGGLVFIICAVYSLIAGLYPFEVSDRIASFHNEFSWEFLKGVLVPGQDIGLGDFLKNVAYFLPWGAICYVFTASPNGGSRKPVLLAALIGAIVSLLIEICQIFFTRYPSVFDVVANTLGAGLGALLCALSPIDVRQIVAQSLRPRLLLLAAFLLGTFPLLISVSNFSWIGFRNWNEGFTFQIANEASLDRPWLGKIYLAAIYDRALAPDEIALHYRVGVSNGAIESRASRGLIALYTFSENRGVRVRDVSGYGSPLNLTLSPSSHFRWRGQVDGLEVIKPAVLRSDGPAKKLYGALRNSGELSVETWIMPANVKQKGPARIISFSRDAVARNFTVGQEGADIDFRLRTPLTGPNGTMVNLRTRDGVLTGEQSHVVATYKDGIERLYVNGREHPDNVDLNKADIMVAFGTKKHPLSQLGYSVFYFFPVSFLGSWLLRARSANYAITVLLPATIAFILLGLAEYFQAHVFARPVDLHLLGYGVVVGSVGALCGASFANETPRVPNYR